jgi:hypothetical protein
MAGAHALTLRKRFLMMRTRVPIVDLRVLTMGTRSLTVKTGALEMYRGRPCVEGAPYRNETGHVASQAHAPS